MPRQRKERVTKWTGMRLSERDQELLRVLAERNDVPQTTLLRSLLRREAKRVGLTPDMDDLVLEAA